MARVQFLNAILSGKLGNDVYARNKGGYYVRTYVPPVQPYTVAQTDAWSTFGSLPASWQALSSDEQSIWNTYAETDLRVKNPKKGVMYSGWNAFFSLWNASLNAQRKYRPFLIYDEYLVNLSKTTVDFIPQRVPPIGVFSYNIQNSEEKPIGIKLKTVNLRSDGRCSFECSFFAPPGGQIGAPIFVEPNTSQKIGFMMFASNVIAKKGNFVSNPNHTILGASKPATITGGWTPGSSSFWIYFYIADPSIPGHLLQYQPGDIVSIEVWAVSQEGTLARIGRKFLKLTA